MFELRTINAPSSSINKNRRHKLDLSLFCTVYVFVDIILIVLNSTLKTLEYHLKHLAQSFSTIVATILSGFVNMKTNDIILSVYSYLQMIYFIFYL